MLTGKRLLELAIVDLSCFSLPFVYIRCFFYGVIRYQINKSTYKKRRKGMNLKEWILYTRFTDELPVILRVLYYSVLVIHPVCLIVLVIVYLAALSSSVAEATIHVLAGFDCVWMLAIMLLFWSPKADYDYGRWISRKRGQRRGKK